MIQTQYDMTLKGSVRAYSTVYYCRINRITYPITLLYIMLKIKLSLAKFFITRKTGLRLGLKRTLVVRLVYIQQTGGIYVNSAGQLLRSNYIFNCGMHQVVYLCTTYHHTNLKHFCETNPI